MNLYIHIPFCASKCSYCHFYSICNTDLIDNYVDALLIELSQRVESDMQIATVYFGGGTPSILTTSQLEKILQQINFDSKTEITIETHPNTLSVQKINDFLLLGINRLSIGVQSWNMKILEYMNRQYDTTQLKKNIYYAQSHILDNINIDHIISYPKQTDNIVKSDIKTTLSLLPQHISMYPLERHPHTQIDKSPPQHKVIRQFALAQTLIIHDNYRHYEELNFSKPNFECKHNLDFWTGHDYIGLGASATSVINNQIITNTNSVYDYIQKSHLGKTFAHEVISIQPSTILALKQNLKSRLL